MIACRRWPESAGRDDGATAAKEYLAGANARRKTYNCSRHSLELCIPELNRFAYAKRHIRAPGPYGVPGDREADPVGSSICTCWSAFTFVSFCESPLGQWTSMLEANVALPNPKCTRGSLEER